MSGGWLGAWRRAVGARAQTELRARVEPVVAAQAAALREEAARDHAATRSSVDAVLGDLQGTAWSIGEHVNVLEARLAAVEAALHADAAAAGRVRDLLALASLPGADALRLPPGTRRRAYAAGPGTRRVICSRATGPHLQMLALVAPTFEAYCRTWGWDLVLSAEEHLAEGRPASWGKLPLVRDLLEEYDLVWWIDSDAIIVDLAHDVTEDLAEDRELFVTEHRFTWDYGSGPQVHSFPNAGVFLLRSGSFARELVDALWERTDLIDSPWWENTALLDLLGYELYPMRRERETPWAARTGALPKAWNSLDDLDEAPEPRLKHHAGNAPLAERRRRLAVDFLAFRRALGGHVAEGLDPEAALTGPGSAPRG